MKPPPAHQEEKLKEIHELAKTPGRVKEHADKWNRMTSESDLKTIASSIQSDRLSQSKEDGDTDSGSVQTLDPLRKKWMLAAALCEVADLVLMLKEDPKLVTFKVSILVVLKIPQTKSLLNFATSLFAS